MACIQSAGCAPMHIPDHAAYPVFETELNAPETFVLPITLIGIGMGICRLFKSGS